MSKKRSKSRSDRPGKRAGRRQRSPSLLDETLAQLEQIKQDTSLLEVRIHADDVRDSVVQFGRAVHDELRRLAGDKRRLQKQCAELRTRLVELLNDLASGPVILPRAADRSAVEHDQLLATFGQLRAEAFPALAGLIHEAAGRGEGPAYQRFLVHKILINGNRLLVENLVRQAGAGGARADEEEFLGKLRHYLAGKVCSGLARQVGYQVTPAVGQQLDDLLGRVLAFLLELLTATPPGRLLLCPDNSPFDPERHEAMAGRPSDGDLRVTATLFPGYVVLSNPPLIREKALVYTDWLPAPSSSAPPPA